MITSQNPCLKILCLITTALLSSCKTVVLEEIPAGGTVPYNEIVYAENDGRCEDGQVLKITGGNNAEYIARKYDCVSRP